jgi:hypothetical protein
LEQLDLQVLKVPKETLALQNFRGEQELQVQLDLRDRQEPAP